MKALNENEITASLDALTDAIMEVKDPDSQRRFVREILDHCVDHPWLDDEVRASVFQNLANANPESFEYTGEFEDLGDDDTTEGDEE